MTGQDSVVQCSVMVPYNMLIWLKKSTAKDEGEKGGWERKGEEGREGRRRGKEKREEERGVRRRRRNST